MDPNSFPDPQPNGTAGPSFPPLPIVTPDPPRRSQREKYGGLFFLGLAGLATLVGLLGWFLQGAWSHRDLWTNVYVLHDGARPEADRLGAAFALSRDPRMNDRQRWDICLRRPLPPLARYLVARSLTAGAASADPRGYALTVARSPDWPDWLRLLLCRPMAYAAARGVKFPREPVVELTRSTDRATALWAAFVLAANDPDDRDGRALLESACRAASSGDDLACLLLDAAKRGGRPAEQRALLDRATRWVDAHHPEAVRLWSGWAVEGDRIVPRPAPELH
jgi:hypothetical protein